MLPKQLLYALLRNENRRRLKFIWWATMLSFCSKFECTRCYSCCKQCRMSLPTYVIDTF